MRTENLLIVHPHTEYSNNANANNANERKNKAHTHTAHALKTKIKRNIHKNYISNQTNKESCGFDEFPGQNKKFILNKIYCARGIYMFVIVVVVGEHPHNTIHASIVFQIKCSFIMSFYPSNEAHVQINKR